MKNETEGLNIKPHKIAISLLDSGGYGGAEEFINQLSSELIKKYNSIIYLIVKNNLGENIKLDKRILIYKFPFRLDFIGNIKGFIKSVFLSPAYLLIGWYSLLKFKLDGGQIILISGISDKIFLTPMAKIINIKVIWIEFGPLTEIFKKNILAKYMYLSAKNLPDIVICPTNNTKKSLILDAKILENKIRVIPCGIKL